MIIVQKDSFGNLNCIADGIIDYKSVQYDKTSKGSDKTFFRISCSYDPETKENIQHKATAYGEDNAKCVRTACRTKGRAVIMGTAVVDKGATRERGHTVYMIYASTVIPHRPFVEFMEYNKGTMAYDRKITKAAGSANMTRYDYEDQPSIADHML